MNAEDAFHAAVHNQPGGCQVVAVRLGRDYTVWKNMVNPQCDSNHLRVRDFILGMEVMGDHSALHALNAQFGYVATKIDQQPASDMAVLESVTDIWAKLGAVGGQVHAALADGKVDQHEVKHIEAAIYTAIRPMMELLNRLNGMAGKC